MIFLLFYSLRKDFATDLILVSELGSCVDSKFCIISNLISCLVNKDGSFGVCVHLKRTRAPLLWRSVFMSCVTMAARKNCNAVTTFFTFALGFKKFPPESWTSQKEKHGGIVANSRLPCFPQLALILLLSFTIFQNLK